MQLPAWGLVALGCYALYCIGLGLFNFGDPGSAAEDLTKVRGLRCCGRRVWSWGALSVPPAARGGMEGR